MSELIARLMAAIETPDDLTQEDVNCLLEDAHIVLQEIEDDNVQYLCGMYLLSWITLDMGEYVNETSIKNIQRDGC